MRNPRNTLKRAFSWTCGLFAFFALMATGRVDAAFSPAQISSDTSVDQLAGGVAYVDADDVDSQEAPQPSSE